MPKYRTLSAEKFQGDMASKNGCQGDPAVGHGNVETLLAGDRPDEGMPIERHGSHA